MSVTEETLRLLYEVKGAKALDDVKKQLQDVAREEANLKALYQQNAIAEEDLAEETERLGRAKADLTAKIDGLNKVAKTFHVSASQLQTGIQQAGYAIGDFASTSGDLGAKLNSLGNNVQYAAAQFGPWGIAVGLAFTAGVALVKNLDTMTRWFETKNPFPAGAKDLAELKRELDRAKDGMAELEKNASLTASELSKYNKLRSDTATIEKKIADEEERQKNLKAFNAPTAAEKEEKDERAKILDGMDHDARGRIVSGLANIRDAQHLQDLHNDRRTVEAQIRQAPTPFERQRLQGRLRQIDRQIAAAQRGENYGAFKEQAHDTVAQAIGGDLGAFNTVAGWMDARPGAFNPADVGAFTLAAPGDRVTKEQLAQAAQQNREADARIAADKAAEKAELEQYDQEASEFQAGITARQEAIQRRNRAADARKDAAKEAADRDRKAVADTHRMIKEVQEEGTRRLQRRAEGSGFDPDMARQIAEAAQKISRESGGMVPLAQAMQNAMDEQLRAMQQVVQQQMMAAQGFQQLRGGWQQLQAENRQVREGFTQP